MGYVACVCEKCVRGLKTRGGGNTHTQLKKTLSDSHSDSHSDSLEYAHTETVCLFGARRDHKFVCVPCMRVSLFCIVCTLLGSITPRNLGQKDLKVTRQPSRFLLPTCSRSNSNLAEGTPSTLYASFILSLSSLTREEIASELPFSTFLPTPQLNPLIN